MSKRADSLRKAFRAGHRVWPDGRVLGRRKMFRKLLVDTRGYFTFNIAGGKVEVHRLLAYQKFGEIIFMSHIQVRHLDGNPRNNSWSNIAVGTQSDNMMDMPRRKRLRRAINAAKSLRRWTDEEVAMIRHDHKNGMSYRQLAIKYKTAKSTLSYLFNKAYY